MKKLFLLALTLVMVCNTAFADIADPSQSSDSVNIVLDLSSSTVYASAGITTDELALNDIVYGYENKFEDDELELPITANSLATGTTFYVWYYVNGMANTCDITFIPTPFVATSDDSPVYLGYNLTVAKTPTVDENYSGTMPTFSTHNVTTSYAPSESAKYIFKNNAAGMSRGFIQYNLAVDYTNAEPLKYVANVTIQISAK